MKLLPPGTTCFVCGQGIAEASWFQTIRGYAHLNECPDPAAALWTFDEDEVTMVKGIAVVGSESVQIDFDVSKADATYKLDGVEVMRLPVAISADIRLELVGSCDNGNQFYIGKSLRYPDKGVRLDRTRG